MAQQIKKKYLSPEIINYFDNQIDSIESNVTSLQSSKADVSYVDSQDTAKLAEAKSYTDTKISEIPSVDLSNYYNKTEVDSKDSGLQTQINTEKGRVDAILSASEADKDSFAEIVALINSVDTANDTAFAGYVTSNNAALAQEVLDRQSGDTSTLNSAKSYTDSKIALIPSVDLSNYYTKTQVDAKETALNQSIDDLDVYAQDIRSDVDSLDVYAQDIRSDVDGHETRITALEAKTDGPSFDNEKIVVGAELGFVDLSRSAKKIMSCAVGRMAIHEGEDFTVSIVAGKTRLTWINSLVNPGGVEAIETNDNIFVVYAY